VGILSTQLIHHQFVESFSKQPFTQVEPATVFDRTAEPSPVG
jgi:hypothetical protein